MAKISKRLNTGDTLLALTSYPDTQPGAKDPNAIASYAKRTLYDLAKGRKVVILAQKTGRRKTLQESDTLFIHRVWTYNPFSMLSVLLLAIQYYNVREVLIQFEFTMFGGPASIAAVIMVIAALRLMRRNVYLEQHEVVRDITAIEDHVAIRGGFKQRTANAMFTLFYRTVGLLTTKVIVLEEGLKNRLTDVVNPAKITVIPHVAHYEHTMKREKALEGLPFGEQDFVVMAFGFMNWYKGSDWIMQAFSKTYSAGLKLLMAGGKSPTMKSQRHYGPFYSRIRQLLKKSPNIYMTGYVPETEIKRYFSAADLVVLPYRYFMSASGPLSRALSYRKPVIMSAALVDYAKNEDFKEAMEKAGLAIEDLFFPLDHASMFGMIQRAKTDEDYRKKLHKFSAILGSKRDVKHIVRQYEDICFPHQLKAEIYKYAFK